jgi:hypothetical protein
MLESNLPDTAEVTLRKQDNSIIVHVLHYIPQRKCRKIDIIDVKIPLYNNEFSVRAETKPKSVFLAPQQEQIDFKFSDGRVEFNVNCIDGHQMIVLEF